MGKYRNKGWIGADDHLDDDYYESFNFENYVSTTKDPGFFLLLLTIIFCVGSLVVAFVWPIEEQENEDVENESGYISIDSISLGQKCKSLRGMNTYGDSTVISEIDSSGKSNQRFRVTNGKHELGELIFIKGRLGDDTRLDVEDILLNWDYTKSANSHHNDKAQTKKFHFRLENLHYRLKSLGCVLCYFDYSSILAKREKSIDVRKNSSLEIASSEESTVTSASVCRERNKEPTSVEESPNTNAPYIFQRNRNKIYGADKQSTATSKSTSIEMNKEHLISNENPNTNTPFGSDEIFGTDDNTDVPNEISEVENKSNASIKESDIANELEEVFNLAVPWTIVDLVSYCSDFVLIMVISHYMGTAVMISYSTVGFILNCFNMLCSGLYGSCYKHVNNSIANNNRYLAGEYIQISIILNASISLPSYLLAIILMPQVMACYGYADVIVEMSQSYAAIAALHSVLENSVYFLETVLDIEGHAKFNAVWSFWESTFSVITSVIIIVTFQPSLLGLGIYHLIEAIIMLMLYIYVTYIQKGWFDSYVSGIFSKNAMKNKSAIISVIKRSVPLLIDDATNSAEWFILSIFAGYQGPAESVVWILLSYIWEIVALIPQSFSDAAASRVAYNLSVGNIELAKIIAGQSIYFATVTAMVLSIPLMICRHFIVWCISVDEVLEQMLLELLPYVALCQPFITLGMAAAALNEGLCMNSHVVKRMAASTFLVTIPIAGVMTCTFHLNVEGLTAAVCMGYVIGGVMNFNLFMHADWHRCMRKNQEVTQCDIEKGERKPCTDNT